MKGLSSGNLCPHLLFCYFIASPVFGVKLEIAVSRSKIADGIELPTVFRECIYYLEEKGTLFALDLLDKS